MWDKQNTPTQPLGHKKAVLFTRLSNLLATMEANRLSPASSEMRKTYSGAFTWLDRWVRPGKAKKIWKTFFTSNYTLGVWNQDWQHSLVVSTTRHQT